tara:strand:- start:1394 stop:1909 length:516 start_codon:yes stop_codon:yes gene_type:complete
MSNNKSLNDILSNYQSLELELIESGGELTEDIEKKICDNADDLLNKMDGYEKFIRYLKKQSEYLQSMEEHYYKRRKVIENSIQRCKGSMINALKITGNTKLKTNEFNFSINMSKKWKIDESSLNDKLKDFLISNGLAENKFKLNISAIKSNYKEEIPDWVEIIENEYIRVS